MKVIGLTGGIGSGKTTVARMFESLGIPVYFSDDEAKIIMTNSAKVKKKLIDEFGKNTFANDKLNRKYLANIIFNDKSKLLKINNIVHPEVDVHFNKWIKLQKSDFVIQENALIFENKKQFNFDDIVTVIAPMNIKIKRVIERDNASEKEILARMNNQLSDDYRISNSRFIVNNIDLEKSESQVYEIYKELTK